MTLRKKGMLTIVLSIAAGIVISLVVSQTILMRRFDALEARETSMNVERVASAIYSNLSTVSITSGNGLPSEAVVFDNTTGIPQAYLKIDIGESTFPTLGLNFILVAVPGIRLDGSGYDLENNISLPVPDDLRSQLSGSSPLVYPPEGQTEVMGILMLSDGPLLIASYPTNVSTGGLTINARLIFARFLNSSEAARLSEVTHVPVTLYGYNDAEFPEQVKTAEPRTEDGVPTYVRALNSDTVAGYGVLYDIYGDPAVVLEVELPRDIHHQGQTTLLYLICALAAGTVALGVVANYATGRSLLSRLLRLSNGVVHVRTTGDLSRRVEVTGNDEMTTLEMSINSMLASLETSQKELRDSEAQNLALVKGIPDFMFRIGTDATLLEARSAKGGNMVEPHRMLHGKMQYRPLPEYAGLSREVITGSLKHMDELFKTRQAQIFEFQLPVDGRDFFYEVRMVTSAKQAELLCVVFDVSQRHEEVKRKEVLIKEVHHRVKNNLQVISSLLYLQSRRMDDKKIIEMFEESANRVKSISLIHEKLYKERLESHQKEGTIDFGEYVRDLTDALFVSYGVDRKVIRLVSDTSNAFLSLDASVPCGLIINELLANSLKYAFPGGRAGEIHISLHGDSDGMKVLVVSDNGVGLPSDLDLDKAESLGLRLVRMLAQQLGADMRLNRNKGTEFKFIFTDISGRERNPASASPSREPVGAKAGGA